MATADDMLRVARAQLGQGEHPPGSNVNKFSQWYGMVGPWCDMFISWCADQVKATSIVGHFAYTPYHAQWFQDHGKWGQKPRVGAIVFFDWGGTHNISAIDHVGIVEAVRADGSIVTIEGNTSDAVMRRVRRSGIAGFGYPAYAAAPTPPPVKPPTALIYGLDVASYQGKPDWAKVKQSGISFAFSKVTQGTGYVNPEWAHNLDGMLALGASFMPGAYHFLEAGADAAAQARHFVSNLGGRVGDLAVALDVEASGPGGASKPTAAEAHAWVAEFKRLTNNHPVIGYLPGWYWQQIGSPDLSFFDGLWQSHYVTGGGSVAGLYGSAQSSWWASYGGEPVRILQFTDKATVPGVSGAVDANAFKGTVAELRALAFGTPAPTPTPTPAQEDDMPFGQLAEGPAAITPISLPRGKYKTVGFVADNGLQVLPAASLRVAMHDKGGWHVSKGQLVDSAKGQLVVALTDSTDGLSVQREDAGDVHVAWEVS